MGIVNYEKPLRFWIYDMMSLLLLCCAESVVICRPNCRCTTLPLCCFAVLLVGLFCFVAHDIIVILHSWTEVSFIDQFLLLKCLLTIGGEKNAKLFYRTNYFSFMLFICFIGPTISLSCFLYV